MVSCVVWEVWDLNRRDGSPLAPLAGGANTSINVSHNVNATNPSIHQPVSKVMTTACAVLCDTAVLFNNAHDVGSRVGSPIVERFVST